MRPFLPGWARDLVRAILGSLSGLIRRLLDLTDDIMEWVSEKIGISLGLINLGLSLILEYFFQPDPILELEDPYTILPAESGLPKVTAPIEDVVFEFLEGPNRLVAGIKLGEA